MGCNDAIVPVQREQTGLVVPKIACQSSLPRRHYGATYDKGVLKVCVYKNSKDREVLPTRGCQISPARTLWRSTTWSTSTHWRERRDQHLGWLGRVGKLPPHKTHNQIPVLNLFVIRISLW